MSPMQAATHAQRLRSLLEADRERHEADLAQVAPWARRIAHEAIRTPVLAPEHRIVLMGFKGRDAEAVLAAYRDTYEAAEAGRDK